MKTIKTTLIAVLILFTGTALYAQESGDITASATVLDAITITGDADLTFGDVERGSSKSIATDDADNRGQFTIEASDRTVLLNFTLPEDLESDVDGTTVQLPIVFSSTDAAWAINGAEESNTFDPKLGGISALIEGGSIQVFIGGTVNPYPEQVAGEYTGTITLTAEYE
jgi:hypothetical protein